MEKQITISRKQLKNLLFWAISGYTKSNGGTGEKYISKINDFFGSNGRTPTYNEFRKMGSMATIYKYFGSC